MSSFIVSQGCMNNIINGIYWNHKFKDFGGHALLEARDLNKSQDFERLANDLFKLNQKAVNGRYPATKGDSYSKVEAFKWESKTVSIFQTMKSLNCLIYQCSEGNVPNTKLYKWLEKVSDALTAHIVIDLPEYNNAKWD